MKISKDGVPNFHSYNEGFNKAVGPLIGDIFQTQDETPLDYVVARPKRDIDDWRPDPIAASVTHEFNPPKGGDERFDLKGLGIHEKVIFSCLAWGSYRTYVLTGDMGSGKTTITKFMTRVLERPRRKLCGLCEHCNPVVVSLDFNQGFRGRDTPDLVDRFRRKLYNQLHQKLRDLFIKNPLTDALIEEINAGKSFYASFDVFAQNIESLSEWRGKANRLKANELFKFIDTQATSSLEKIEYMMALVRLAKERLRSDPACLIFIYDNIDSIWPEAQYEILVDILSYQDIAEARALVVLRRATFEGLQNQAAFSFGCIDHTGPDVAEIIRRRIEHHYNGWDQNEKVKLLPAQYQRAAKNRLKYLLDSAREQHSVLDRIACISGASVRLGLYASERLLLNGAIQYDKDPRNKDDLFRSVLIAQNQNLEIAQNDPCVANLVLDPMTGMASLLPIRILQLVDTLEKEPAKRNVRNILIMLRHIGAWNGEQVRRSINYLLNMRRPLLWVDSKVQYESVKSMQSYDDKLYITEAGHRYLHNLMSDLVYIQETTLCVEWDSDWMPKAINYSSVVDRFRFVRGAIREIMTQDMAQTEEFKKWLANRSNYSIALRLISNRILASVGVSTLNVLAHLASQPGINGAREELRDWLSMINIGLENERKISGSYRKLDQLSQRYNAFLRSTQLRKG